MLPCCIDGLCSGVLLENIKNKTHEVFLNDLMVLLCRECRVPWQPSCECSYAIHPASPLHLDIRDYVRNSYRKIYAHMELNWFNHIRKFEKEVEKRLKERENERKSGDSFNDELNETKFDDDEDDDKKPGKFIEACYLFQYIDDTILNKSLLNRNKKSGITDETMIIVCENELNKRRSRLFYFLDRQNMFDVFMEILQTALSCIALYELGMTDAVFSGVTVMIQAFDEYFKKTGCTFDSILHRISLLVKKLPHDNWPSYMVGRLHEIFARDLLYFMCSIRKVKWYPPDYEKYTINMKSPLTIAIQRYIEKFLPDLEGIVYILKNSYPEKDSVFAAFSFGIKTILGEISIAKIPSTKSTEDLFLLILNLTKLVVELRKHGMHGILSPTYRHLPNVLRKCNEKNNGRIFDLFNAFAKLENQKKDAPKAKPLDLRYFFPPTKANEIVFAF